jgi:hypothetical protein
MSSAAELFNYNRENFKFNKELRQTKLHMHQNMRTRQVLLYREDLRDLFELTIGKMDSYMIVNVLLLGISAEMYFKGREPIEVPGWLLWCWSISLSGAFFFILFSTWLALHASVHAQTYMARCLTQWLRLPIPSINEISAASARLEEYEKSTLLDFVRPPVVVPDVDKEANNSAQNRDLSTHWNEFSEHFELFNSLHTKWQSHEAYARVSMCFGTNMLFSAFSYFSLSYYTVKYEDPWIGGVLVVLATLAQLIHIRMSLSLTEREHYLQMALVMIPPACLAVAAALSTHVDSTTGLIKVPTGAIVLACIGYVFQFSWILFFLRQTNHDEEGLPMKFSTVWCLEILGLGIETIRDIEEPQVDFPGFIQPSSDFRERPLNTFDASHLESTNIANGSTKVGPDSVPSDVLETCKSLESKLQSLFSIWGRQGHQLTDEELSFMEELKVAFDADTELLASSLKRYRRKKKSEVTDSSSGFNSSIDWVRLTYETDDGATAPYFMNPETGELRWEDGASSDLQFEINRGLSLIPEQLEKYHDSVRKIQYASRRDRALRRQKKTKAPKWPWELFRAGAILILLCWVAALVETILDKLGYEPTLTPLVTIANIPH